MPRPPLSLKVNINFSESDSDLSSPPSRCPTPPSFVLRGLPTPPASQRSSTTCSLDDRDSSTCPSSTEGDGSRPPKRRRLTPPMPRETKRLDLSPLANDHSALQASGENPDLQRLLMALRKKRKIVVVAGAGISVSAGIPDFRSDTGLFKSLRAEHKLKSSGKDLFDAAVYRDQGSTKTFHSMVRNLSHMTKEAAATPFHHLLARLAHEGRLLRLYSQNVDGIDTSLQPLATEVPLPRKGPWPKTVQLHGGLDKMTCTKCHKLSDFKAELFDGPIPPECTSCQEVDHIRTEHAGKRSHGIGKLRPRMVLYNEHNPDDEAIGAVTKADLRTRPDCVLVVGTSLKVPGVRRIVREMCAVVRDRRDGLTAWINNSPEPSGKDLEKAWDIVVKGNSDDVARLVDLRKWDDDDIGQVKEVTVEEVRQAKERATFELKVPTPQIPSRYKDVEALHTPLESPKLSPIPELPAVQQPLTINFKPLPASAGPSIIDVLGKIQAPAKPREQPKIANTGPKKANTTATAPTRKPGRPKKNTGKAVDKPAPAANATLGFKQTKNIPDVYQNSFKVEKPSVAPELPYREPLAPSPSHSNANYSPMAVANLLNPIKSRT